MADNTPSGPWSAEEYDRLAGFGGDWRDTWYNPDFLKLMAERWQLKAAHRLLDVGCGAGHWGHLLAPHVAEDCIIEACDVEPAFVTAAQERAEKRGIARYAAQVGDAEALPFEDNRFDVVTCQTVLIHVGDLDAALSEMLRVLKPGGVLAVAEPNNLACSVVELSIHPRRPWPEVQRLLQFQWFVEQGKIAKGRGDSSVGDLLPGKLSQLGLQNVNVVQNDKCAALFPPYADPIQKMDLEQWSSWYRSEIWPVAGHKDDTLDLFVAGGGRADEFEGYWQDVLRRQADFLEAAEKGEMHGARGFTTYLAWGTKT